MLGLQAIYSCLYLASLKEKGKIEAAGTQQLQIYYE